MVDFARNLWEGSLPEWEGDDRGRETAAGGEPEWLPTGRARTFAHDSEPEWVPTGRARVMSIYILVEWDGELSIHQMLI